MSTPNLCLPSNPDTSGIGVRTAIYAQNLLSFVPALFALQDGKVTPLELEALETQSTTILITAFAILLSVIVQALQHGLTNYHAAIILNLSWMNNTSLFIYFVLYAYHTAELRDEEVKQGGDQRALRAFWVSRMKKAMRNPVLIIGSAHLSLMSAVGIWLWVKPLAFGNSLPCSLSASLFVVGQQASIGSQGLREWSLLVYSLLLLPGLNLIVPICFFATPIWIYGRCFSSLKQESMIRFARAGLAVLAIINIVLLVDTEVAIRKNRDLVTKGDGDWTFGQTLALLLLLIPMRDVGEALLERRAKRVGEKLKTASKAGNMDMVCDAIKSGVPKGAMESSIIAAFKEGHWNVVAVLLGGTASVKATYPSLQATLTAASQINAINSDGQTALHYAAENGHSETVRCLAELGADLSTEDADGRTALHFSAENGHSETVRCLAELGANLNIQGLHRQTALHFAARNRHSGTVRCLAELGADLNTQDSDERTALHYAAMNGGSKTVRYLAEFGANLNIQDSDGRTALHYTVKNRHFESTRCLAEHGANLNIQGLYRQTALHYAAMNGDSETVRYLAELRVGLSIQDSDGHTALHYAVESGNPEAVIRHLAKFGMDLNIQGPSKKTALHYAVGNKNSETARLLAELGADLNIQDVYRKTALHDAAKNGHSEIIKLLAEHGADLNIQDSDGWTALHYAAKNGDSETVRLLAELKVNTIISGESYL
ncbi:hypothetical protein D9756_000056 [Leucocoprinus leucothites]|uniref:Ankyrin repeat protein n=1 Tax=Leucocoprinus leucothites TaxID=201217 RepID=A0A8H5LN32_9AGAR|nr:hypothetical protein D9756_000056 [Leucoagaricus leucothites]